MPGPCPYLIEAGRGVMVRAPVDPTACHQEVKRCVMLVFYDQDRELSADQFSRSDFS